MIFSDIVMPDIHCKKIPELLLINKAITLHIYLFFFFTFWVRTFKFDTLKISVMEFSVINYSLHVIPYVLSLTHLIAEHLYPFTSLFLIPSCHPWQLFFYCVYEFEFLLKIPGILCFPLIGLFYLA